MIIDGTENSAAEPLLTRLGLAPGAAAVSTLERQVTGERIRLVTERSRRESVLGALFAASAVVLLWPSTDPRLLLAWFALAQLPAVARTLLERGYHRMASDVRDSRHPYWAHRFSVCSAASGVAWGGLVVLLPTAGPAEIAALFGLHAAYLAFAAGLLTAWLPAYLGFALSSTVAFAAFALFAADALAVQRTVLLIAVAAGSACVAHAAARSLIDTLRARFEREETLVRLVAERERAELEVRSRERLLASASHDLRQPLLALDLYTGVLRSKVRDTEADAVAARIQQSIAALSAMLDSALDVSALGSDGTGGPGGGPGGGPEGDDGASRPVPLDALLARVVGDHELQARAKGLSLSIEGRSGLLAQADPTQLARVLMNLLGNAIKFTERGGVVVRVVPDGERVLLSVRDSGRGIAEGERQRIFAEYHQSRRADRAGGQGLGLAIVKRLCAAMDVSIELVSAPGAGSDFRLSIPRGTAGTPRRALRGRADA